MDRRMVSAVTVLPSSETDDSRYVYDYSYENSSLVFLDESEAERFGGTFSGVLYILVFFLSLAGNGFLLWALLGGQGRRRGVRKTSDLFLLQLTVSDLLLTLSLPFWATYHLHHWVFGRMACHLLTAVFFLGFFSYMAFLVAMTVDRYLAVVRAVPASSRFRARRCFWLTSAALWLVCTGASVPDAVFTATSEDGTLCQPAPLPQQAELAMYFLQVGAFFLLPFAIILYCYARIWATILRCRSGRRDRAIRLIFCIVVGFFLCWAPYNVVLFLRAVQLLGWEALSGERASEDLDYAYYVCHVLAYCHCFLNPALHIFGGGTFRSFLSLECCRWGLGRGRSQTLTSQNSAQKGSASHQTFV